MAKNRAEANSDRQRLQKVLAAAGLGSRRECEELILHGRVEVDNQVVDTLGTRVDPDTQRIRVDGVVLRRPKRRYFVVHKPPGVLSTSKDPWGRARVIDLVDARERLFAIGRLDKDSSGLILVTNDGELANQLTHPRYGVQKTYHVTVAGSPTQEVLRKVRRGVVLSEGPVKPESVVVKKRVKNTTQLEIVLAEGKNREIRRMLARFDHKVLRLHRIAIGPVRLGLLPAGDFRELTRDEVKKLRECCTKGKSSTEKRRPPRKRKTKRAAAPAPTGRPTRRKRSSTASPKQGTVLGGESLPAEKPRKRKTATGGKKTARRRRAGS